MKPDSADGYLQLGCALHFDPETFAEATAAYQKSLELEPGQFVALANLGDVNLQMGRIEEARDSLIQAGNINSNDPKLTIYSGKFILDSGDAMRHYASTRF